MKTYSSIPQKTNKDFVKGHNMALMSFNILPYVALQTVCLVSVV